MNDEFSQAEKQKAADSETRVRLDGELGRKLATVPPDILQGFAAELAEFKRHVRGQIDNANAAGDATRPLARSRKVAGRNAAATKVRKRQPWVDRLAELDAKHRNVSKANAALWREYHAACPKYGVTARNLPQQWAGKCDRWRKARKAPAAVS